MNNPLVSVLVPVYNVSSYIQRSIRSIFDQTYDNLEIIIIDDKTPDDSIEIVNDVLKKYPNRQAQVKIISHSANRGLSAARNTAVDNSTGLFLVHVDSDDYIAPTAISESIELINKYELDAVVWGISHVYKDHIGTQLYEIPRTGKEYADLLLKRELPVRIWGSIIKSSLYKQYGIRAVNGLNFGEDYAVTPRLFYNANRIIALQKPYYYYVHFNSNSYSRNFSSKDISSLRLALDVLNDFFKDKKQYKDAIVIAYSRVKSELFLRWAVGNGSKEDYRKIGSLCNTKLSTIFKLPLKYALILLFSWNATILKFMLSLINKALYK